MTGMWGYGKLRRNRFEGIIDAKGLAGVALAEKGKKRVKEEGETFTKPRRLQIVWCVQESVKTLVGNRLDR